MFEVSVALKYLVPRWRQLSVSIISLISILVIALVVWLIVVFFSVTRGLENNWVQKLVALTAPVRLTPTEAYYDSYYYKIDSISANAQYAFKSIGEKAEAGLSNPYDPEMDEEIPDDWQEPRLNPDGSLQDIVKETFEAIGSVKGVEGIRAKDYEVALGGLKILLARDIADDQQISYTAFIGSYDPDNPALVKAMLPASERDFGNLYKLAPAMSRPKEHDRTLLEKQLAPYFNGERCWFDGCDTPGRLPSSPDFGDGILLPKNFREAGVLIGDRGAISYHTTTASSVREQKIPVYVAGFYDPGIIPIGGKFVIANQDVASVIRTAYEHPDGAAQSNGINVRFDDFGQADAAKARILSALEEKGLSSYWQVSTFREFDFSRDLLQQLKSEKNLFTLISGIIIIVACSNIISMLIILVNDKKVEIGILRSMGAASQSIASIFAICGVTMGLLGSAIGLTAAFFTLQNLQGLINLISAMQGFDAFNPVFYGETLPNEISFEAVVFVMGVTGAISLIAGIVPAVKACSVRPSAILRSE